MAKLSGNHFALLAALISGVSIFANKYAVTAVKQPLIFTTLKNTGVALLILGLLAAGGKWRQLARLTRRELGFLVLVGIIGGSIPFYLFFTGLATIPAISGALIQKTLVIWVALLAGSQLKEKLTKVEAVAVCLMFLANILVGGWAGFKFSAGEGLVLLATLFWSVEIILAKKVLPTVDPDILASARMGLGAVILLLMSAFLQPVAFRGVLTLSGSQWAWVGLSVVLLLAYVTTWYRALKFAPAVSVTAILVASTLVTNALSAIFVTHTPATLLNFPSLLIITGLVILYRRQYLPSPVA